MPAKVRMARCRELAGIVEERAHYQRGTGMAMGVPWNDRMTHAQQLSRRVLDLVRMLDFDTDKRIEQKMTSFPEPLDLMTKHTRRVHLNKQRREKKVRDVCWSCVLLSRLMNYVQKTGH